MPHADRDFRVNSNVPTIKPSIRDYHADDMEPGSDLSDLSALEDETDDFGRRILEHQREQLRQDRRTTTRAVWLDQSRSRLLSARQKSEKEAAAQIASNNVVPEPSLNIPKGWRRRETKRPDWSRKASDGSSEEPLRNAGALRGNGGSWEIAVNEPLPSIENDTPSKRRGSTPSSMHHMNTTLHAESTSESNDFSSMSLLTSTPAINSRNRRIDRLARAGIGELAEEGRVSRETLVQGPDHRPVTAPESLVSRLPRHRRTLYGDKENLEPPEYDLESNKHTTTTGVAHRTARPVTFKNAANADQKRTESHNLLRQLARVSKSPSPAAHVATRDSDAQQALRLSESPLRAKSIGSSRPSGTIDKPIKNEYGVADEIAAVQTDNNRAMRSSGRKTPAEPTSKPTLPHNSMRPSPNHTTVDAPKSALADIIAEARGQPGGPFGDATLNSLNEILGPDVPAAVSKPDIVVDQALQQLTAEIQEKTVVSRALKSQQSDDSIIEAMNKRLRAVSASIKDVVRNLRRVESRVEKDEQEQTITSGSPVRSNATLADKQKKAKSVVRVQPRDYEQSHVCETCDRHRTSAWGALWTEFAGCFYVTEPSSQNGAHFTWLGLLCVVGVSWLLTELALCDSYCQPRYAMSMNGYGVNPDAPEFPYVIPTLLFRPMRWLWQPLLQILAWSLGVLFPAWEEVPQPSSKPYLVSLTSTSVRAAKSAVNGLDEMGDFFNENLWT